MEDVKCCKLEKCCNFVGKYWKIILLVKLCVAISLAATFFVMYLVEKHEEAQELEELEEFDEV